MPGRRSLGDGVMTVTRCQLGGDASRTAAAIAAIAVQCNPTDQAQREQTAAAAWALAAISPVRPDRTGNPLSPKDVDVLRPAFRGQLGWEVGDDGAGRFLFVLGPKQGTVADDECAARIWRLTEAGLLTFKREAGYSGVTTLPPAWKYDL